MKTTLVKIMALVSCMIVLVTAMVIPSFADEAENPFELPRYVFTSEGSTYNISDIEKICYTGHTYWVIEDYAGNIYTVYDLNSRGLFASTDSKTMCHIYNGAEDYNIYLEFNEGGDLVTNMSGLEYDTAGTSNYDIASFKIYFDANEVGAQEFADTLKQIGGNVALERGGSMWSLVDSIFDGFGSATTGVSGGIKSAFNGIIYADGEGGAFSPLVLFIFTMAGLAIATGILYKIFTIVRARRKG